MSYETNTMNEQRRWFGELVPYTVFDCSADMIENHRYIIKKFHNWCEPKWQKNRQGDSASHEIQHTSFCQKIQESWYDSNKVLWTSLHKKILWIPLGMFLIVGKHFNRYFSIRRYFWTSKCSKDRFYPKRNSSREKSRENLEEKPLIWSGIRQQISLQFAKHLTVKQSMLTQ